MKTFFQISKLNNRFFIWQNLPRRCCWAVRSCKLGSFAAFKPALGAWPQCSWPLGVDATSNSGRSRVVNAMYKGKSFT